MRIEIEIGEGEGVGGYEGDYASVDGDGDVYANSKCGVGGDVNGKGDNDAVALERKQDAENSPLSKCSLQDYDSPKAQYSSMTTMRKKWKMHVVQL